MFWQQSLSGVDWATDSGWRDLVAFKALWESLAPFWTVTPSAPVPYDSLKPSFGSNIKGMHKVLDGKKHLNRCWVPKIYQNSQHASLSQVYTYPAVLQSVKHHVQFSYRGRLSSTAVVLLVLMRLHSIHYMSCIVRGSNSVPFRLRQHPSGPSSFKNDKYPHYRFIQYCDHVKYFMPYHPLWISINELSCDGNSPAQRLTAHWPSTFSEWIQYDWERQRANSWLYLRDIIASYTLLSSLAYWLSSLGTFTCFAF